MRSREFLTPSMLSEADIGTLTIGPVRLTVDDHAIDRAIDRGVNPDDVDQVLRRLPRVQSQLAAVDTGSKIWVYAPDLSTAVGLRRLGGPDLRFKLKTLWGAGRPMDYDVSAVIEV